MVCMAERSCKGLIVRSTQVELRVVVRMTGSRV